MDRRFFLKWAGLGTVGLSAAPFATALARPVQTERAPGAPLGKRWAMVVDTRKCLQNDGCRACTAACHEGHNVPSMPKHRHQIKWIWKAPFEHVFPQQVTPYMSKEMLERPSVVMCNHCDNPPCVRVCPTEATFRREDGLVMMDEHRCIGCRYCVVACPYGARSFNWLNPRPYIQDGNPSYPTRTRGVVEKCTFCAERLAVGERPLCVEACERTGAGALTFGDLGDPSSPVRAVLRDADVLRRKPELGTGPHVFYVI